MGGLPMRRANMALAIIMMAILSVSSIMVVAEDSNASGPTITSVEQKENPNTNDNYLFVYFSEDLSGVGNASIPEVGLSFTYNFDAQSNKSRFALNLGGTILPTGVYSLILYGATSLDLSFRIGNFPEITSAVQKLNPDNGAYYLFINFDRNLSGMGEVRIPETGFKTMYNADGQKNKDTLALMIGYTPYEFGTYTLILTGTTEFTQTFVLDDDVDVTVTCVMIDGFTYDVTVRSGSKMSELEIPEAPSGYVFDCWMDGSLNHYDGDSTIDGNMILFPVFVKSVFISEDFQVYMKNMGSRQTSVMVASMDGGIIADGKLTVTFYYTMYDDFVGDYTTKYKQVDTTISGDGSTMVTIPVGMPAGFTTIYSASATFTSNGVSNGSGAVFC